MLKTALIAAAALTVSAAPALAAGQAWQVGNNSFHVYFTDLDLHTTAGRAQALARVEAVAARACGDIGARSEVRACRAQTIAASSKGVMAPVLKLAMEERSGTIALAQVD